MKKILILIALTMSSIATAQDRSLIQVNGTSELQVTPDTAILSLQVREIEETMSDALKSLDKKTTYYIDLLKRLGYEEDDIKTTQFSVTKHRVYKKNEYVDSGYVAAQRIKLEFKQNRDNLTSMLSAFAKSPEEVNFSIGFKLSDELRDETRGSAMKAAVKDAKKKAILLANTAGVDLQQLKKIVYGSPNIGYPRNDMIMETRAVSLSADQSQQDFNITPDDITFRESVLMEWYIQ
ncbi:MAG: SIMPL domain-containing protein [Flavobacteriaceae bacterium]|nr:SIMPL domain-containing protein [Bacteroidia bacterium]NNK88587.1 SIMPL domain-containing protein [Flavobacteriaceae bacterium]